MWSSGAGTNLRRPLRSERGIRPDGGVAPDVVTPPSSPDVVTPPPSASPGSLGGVGPDAPMIIGSPGGTVRRPGHRDPRDHP
jgi:hypothetical protein